MFIFNQNLFSLKRKGRKSAAQTPSPAKERIYGSSKNPKGSAASKSAASKITLSEGIVDTLKDKAESFNDKYPSKDVSVNTLKAVMRRGMGAYSTSHRPAITGGVPNSRQAWGFARVNKFLEKKAGKAVKKAYVQDDDLLEKGGTISNNVVQFMKWYVNWLKGIQGKMNIYISIPNEFSQIKGIKNFVFLDLFEKKDQSVSAKSYLKEITEKADELGVTIVLEPIPRNNNVSKQYLIDYYSMLGFQLDENGMMVRKPKTDKLEQGGLIAPNGKPSNLTPEQYRLVRTPEFKAWFGDWENDPENASKVVDENGEPLVVYHGTSQDFNVFKYGEFGFHFGTYEQAFDRIKNKVELGWKYRMINVFLDIKGLFEIKDIHRFNWMSVSKELFNVGIINSAEYIKIKNNRKGQQDEILKDILYKKEITGFKYQNQFEGKGYSYLAFMPNQIKLADGTNTTFDANNPDIRYADGGEMKDSIALPDTTSTYDKLKPILENQGYELNKIKMEDNTILDSDTQLNIDYFNKVKAEMGMSVLKPEVPVEQIAKEQGVSFAKVREELMQGTEVEKEHTNVEEAARAVASQHLQERIDHYDKLDQLEKSPIKKDSGGYIVSEKGGREIAHNNADMGGILVGRRHSQGGIKGRNKGSNQHIEVEGGEIVVSSKAVGASDSHTFNGKSMSNREILSFLNTEGGGVAFKAGGETDKPIEYEGGEVILTRGVLKNPKKYEFNGRMMTSKEIASAINEKHTGVSFDEGGDVPEVEVEMSYDKVSDIHSLVDYLFDAYDLKTLPVYLRTLILHSKMVGMEIPHMTKRGGVVHNNMVYGIYDYIEMHDGRIVDYFVSDFVPASHGFNHFGEYKQLPLLTEYEVKDLLEAHLIKDIKLIEYYCIKYGK